VWGYIYPAALVFLPLTHLAVSDREGGDAQRSTLRRSLRHGHRTPPSPGAPRNSVVSPTARAQPAAAASPPVEEKATAAPSPRPHHRRPSCCRARGEVRRRRCRTVAAAAVEPSPPSNRRRPQRSPPPSPPYVCLQPRCNGVRITVKIPNLELATVRM
jgi:hypothetical protein